jgi:hypothetical protein
MLNPIVILAGIRRYPKKDQGVLVIASIIEIMLASNETIGPEEPRVMGPVVKVSAFDAVEDIGVLYTHRRVVLRGRIARLTQNIGERMWSGRNNR